MDDDDLTQEWSIPRKIWLKHLQVGTTWLLPRQSSKRSVAVTHNSPECGCWTSSASPWWPLRSARRRFGHGPATTNVAGGGPGAATAGGECSWTASSKRRPNGRRDLGSRPVVAVRSWPPPSPETTFGAGILCAGCRWTATTGTTAKKTTWQPLPSRSSPVTSFADRPETVPRRRYAVTWACPTDLQNLLQTFLILFNLIFFLF